MRSFTEGAGADAVIIFAATTSNDPIEQAADLARERGRIVVPGLVGLDLPLEGLLRKGALLQGEPGLGTGLYDPNYEERGLDYPAAFVRWTARRNMGQFLEMIAARQVRVAPLDHASLPAESAVEVYGRLLEGKERFMGVLLTDGRSPTHPPRCRSTGPPCVRGRKSERVTREL